MAFFSKETFKRSLYENIGIEIDDVTSKTSDKFQFTISDSINTWVAFRAQTYMGESTNYKILDKVDFTKGKFQKSDYKVMLVSSNVTQNSNWVLELKYERETPNGMIQAYMNEGMAIETGQISNGTDTIIIKQIFVRGKKLENNQYADIVKL